MHIIENLMCRVCLLGNIGILYLGLGTSKSFLGVANNKGADQPAHPHSLK